MKVYFDSSVVLRRLLGEKNPLKDWEGIKVGFSSRLLKLECLRALDRMRLNYRFSPEEMSMHLNEFYKILSHLGMLPLSLQVIEKAEQPTTTPLSSLDAIHLATALLWQETHGSDFIFATHDHELAIAAEAHGLQVIGI